jgi:hypothetical protein
MIPKRRDRELLVHEVDGEIVIYDTIQKRAHRLNESAVSVWSLIDGERTTAEIAAHLEVDQQVVDLALDDLAKARLLEEMEPLSVSRREALRSAASAAAVGFLLPAVTSIVAPLAVEAQSGGETVSALKTPARKKVAAKKKTK